MNYDALKTDYDRDGFVVVRDFVTGDAPPSPVTFVVFWIVSIL